LNYYINETPDEELVESKPFSKNSYTEKSIDNSTFLPYPKNTDTENTDTNNTNKLNTNSFYYNQSINPQPTKSDSI
jgi:hypothetical protein